MFKKEAPFIPVNEFSGIITELNCKSSDSFGLKVGDKVFGCAENGSLATETICPLKNIYKCPDSVDLTQVAGFEINYGTSYHGLVDVAKIKAGDLLLVLGASGGVGITAIDIGKALGCKVIAVASTAEKLEVCRKAGADILLNYNKTLNGGKSLKALLKEAKVYGKIDVVYDPVGGEFSEQALRSLAWGGRFLVIGFASGGTKPKDAIPKIPLNLALLNERQILGTLLGGWKLTDENTGNRKNMAKMMEMLKEGKLKPLISKEYNFSNFQNAFEDMMSRKVIGKVIVTPNLSKKSNL